MSRAKIITAIAGALFFAIPTVSLMSAMVFFPLIMFALFAIVANFAPVAILAARGLRAAGIALDETALIQHWVYFGILWLGTAFGLSRWGDAGASIGGKNTPYLDMLFMPWHALASYLGG